MEQKSNPLASQVGGSHYKDMKIQPVEFIHANNIPFIEGACIKYLCRHRNKGRAEDLRKVIHFCEMLIDMEYGDEEKQFELEVNTDGSVSVSGDKGFKYLAAAMDGGCGFAHNISYEASHDMDKVMKGIICPNITSTPPTT